MRTVIRVLLVLALLAASGCASLVNGPDRALAATELVGVYDYGHAGFAETLELRADGSYKRTLRGHLRQGPDRFCGTWRIEGTGIAFTAAAGEPASSAPEPAEAFFHRRRPALAPRR